MLKYFSVLFTLLNCQRTLDLNNSSALTKATNAATSNLFAYYSPTTWGYIPPLNSLEPLPEDVQWYENGIMYEIILKVAQITADPTNIGVVTDALSYASWQKVGSFLGPTELQTAQANSGKWNDDIGWWGMGPITGAEMFGPKQLMPLGVTFLSLATSTVDSIWESWDNQTCNGGIFWSRNRLSGKAREAYYKSTITNVQYISSSTRIYLITKDQAYLDRSILVWNWLNNIGLVTSEGNIYDGFDSRDCLLPAQFTISYIYGQAIDALTYLYLATNNQTYLSTAEKITKVALTRFSLGDVIRDVDCEPKCDINTVAPKGILVRGLGVLYRNASLETQQLIKKYATASFLGMLKTCNQK